MRPCAFDKLVPPLKIGWTRTSAPSIETTNPSRTARSDSTAQ